jgi:hypothetical protein
MESKHRTEGTDFDSKSIMLYSFPASWTQDGTGTTKNNELSSTDIAHLRRLYPPATGGSSVRRRGIVEFLRWLTV